MIHHPLVKHWEFTTQTGSHGLSYSQLFDWAMAWSSCHLAAMPIATWTWTWANANIPSNEWSVAGATQPFSACTFTTQILHVIDQIDFLQNNVGTEPHAGFNPQLLKINDIFSFCDGTMGTSAMDKPAVTVCNSLPRTSGSWATPPPASVSCVGRSFEGPWLAVAQSPSGAGRTSPGGWLRVAKG